MSRRPNVPVENVERSTTAVDGAMTTSTRARWSPISFAVQVAISYPGNIRGSMD
jgi:hypothetical protein